VALTKEEKGQVEKHIEHAANILQGIDFELPIHETILQMNEHLDGSGYPAGIKNQQISQPARILAVANSFCAMIKPRSYRPARPVEEIFAILKTESHMYDLEVILALEKVATSAIGERIISSSEPTKES
jgi:HD-GYP domain-containing protein (c-di-GMP phosphodiesterase class II)